MMHIRKESPSEEKDNQAIITFSKKDVEEVLPHEDDLMVIKVQIQNLDVKHALIHMGSSADVLYWDAFKGINFDITELFPFNGRMFLLMMTTFGNRENTKRVLVKYLIINVASPYNVIIDKPSFNALEAALSTMYLTLKYPLKDGRVGIIKGDQEITKKCYEDSLKIKKRSHVDESVEEVQINVNLVNIDPREDPVEVGLTPI